MILELSFVVALIVVTSKVGRIQPTDDKLNVLFGLFG